MRERWVSVLLAGGVVAAAASGAVVFALVRDSDSTRLGGPLACSGCAQESASLPVDPGEPLTHGLVLLRNRGDRPARLLGVEALNLSEGLELIGALVVDAAQSPAAATAIGRGFPPADLGPATQLEGGIVPVPRRRGEVRRVLLGFVADRPGVFVFRGVAVDYAVDGTRYRALFDESMRVCVPEREHRGRCHPPELDR